MAAIIYSLLVDNVPASPALVDALEHIEAETRLGMASILRLRFGTALSNDGAEWVVVDDESFERLTSVRLLVTVGTGLPSVVFDGHVIENSLTLSEEAGASTYTVVAMDGSVLMNLDEKVREWPNMADSTIASLIFAEHTMVPFVETTQPVRTQLDTTVMQRDTDIRFLRHLAHRNGFDVYVRPGPVAGIVEGHFHRPYVDIPAQSALSINMGEHTNVTAFNAKYNMVRPTKTAASGVDAQTVKAQPIDAGSGQLTELGSRALLNGDRTRKTILKVTGLSESGELQTTAQAALERSTWAVTAEGELETAKYGHVLTVGSPIPVRGAGSTYSGHYFVERVLHRIVGEAYTQHFTLRRNALEPTGTENFIPDAALPV